MFGGDPPLLQIPGPTGHKKIQLSKPSTACEALGTSRCAMREGGGTENAHLRSGSFASPSAKEDHETTYEIIPKRMCGLHAAALGMRESEGYLEGFAIPMSRVEAELIRYGRWG